MTLTGFDAKADSEPSLIEQEFERFYHNVMPHLTQDQATKLVIRIRNMELMPVPIGVDNIAYGADYDIKIEVENLIQAVRAMKSTVMTEGGQIKSGVTPAEMRQVVTSTTSLMTLLMKSHEQLMNFDRQRILEQCTVDTLRELGGEEIVTSFVKMMEDRLGADD